MALIFFLQVCVRPEKAAHIRRRRPSVLDNQITPFMHTTSSQYAEMLREAPESTSTSGTNTPSSEDDTNAETNQRREEEKTITTERLAHLHTQFNAALSLTTSETNIVNTTRPAREVTNNSRPMRETTNGAPRVTINGAKTSRTGEGNVHHRRRKQSVYQRPMAYEIDAFGTVKESFRFQRLSLDNGDGKKNNRFNNRRMTVF